jgi:radical SAM superfamily enzyme YgiQ (UPF0313 family)
MRVAIIAPPYPLEEAPAPPLGVTYVAAAFEAAGSEVMILDYIVSRYTRAKLERALDAFQPDLVGATSVTMNFPVAAEILKTAKEIAPYATTVMGGPHVTFDVLNTLSRYPEIDLLVLGEGEETIRELTPVLGTRSAWPSIKGIAFRENGVPVVTESRGFIQDLETIPMPARHLLPTSRYQALGFPVSIITSRGCPNRCIFCQGRRMVGSRVRYRDPLRVVDEIEDVLSYGFHRINIADDLFLSDKARARAICDEILRRDLTFTWSAFVRVNIMDADILKRMRKAGCDTVSFGIESGSPEMLKRIRKGITLEQGRRAVAFCREAGITPFASFMVGLPGESQDTLRETEAYAADLNILHGYHILAPFPGTTVREEIDRYDLDILTDDWSQYDANRAIVRTSRLSAEDIEGFVSAFERADREHWEKIEKEYGEGSTLPEEGLRVEGHYRMHLTYRLLSEDTIEEHCQDLPGDPRLATRTPEDLLFERVTQVTGLKNDLVTMTLRDFVARGYLKVRENGDRLSWYWTHNNRTDVAPHESCPFQGSSVVSNR